jgi:hypothetical protein
MATGDERGPSQIVAAARVLKIEGETDEAREL